MEQPPKCTAELPEESSEILLGNRTVARTIMDRTTSQGPLKSRSYISHDVRTGQVFNEQNSLHLERDNRHVQRCYLHWVRCKASRITFVPPIARAVYDSIYRQSLRAVSVLTLCLPHDPFEDRAVFTRLIIPGSGNCFPFMSHSLSGIQ